MGRVMESRQRAYEAWRASAQIDPRDRVEALDAYRQIGVLRDGMAVRMSVRGDGFAAAYAAASKALADKVRFLVPKRVLSGEEQLRQAMCDLSGTMMRDDVLHMMQIQRTPRHFFFPMIERLQRSYGETAKRLVWC